MVFSSAIFLFLFLPVVLGAYFLVRSELRNIWLLSVSLFFYACGERKFIYVLLLSIVLNYLFGLWLSRVHGRGAGWIVALSVLGNLTLLGWFKYAGFFTANCDSFFSACGFGHIAIRSVHLPLGISFFTFHALSYVIDVYRREVKPLHNPIDFALYISFFPQSIAGPIVRYHDVASQLSNRIVTVDGFAEGVRRFILGLAKKMLIANTLAIPADGVFGLPAAALTPSLAWLGSICYMLQLYFDFSGYSDMAIGLARMFGFQFLENFDRPYLARSITEFWRRWHISLSSWYRDYLYIPLGGNRHGTIRTYVNLVIVFFLCGLWHGASWTFVIWGLYHGCFLVLERLGFGRLMQNMWRPVQHAYALLVVLLGWVLFRAGSLPQALGFMQTLIGRTNPSAAPAAAYPVEVYLTWPVCIALVAGVLGCLPILPWLSHLRKWLIVTTSTRGAVAALTEVAFATSGLAVLMVLLIGSMMVLASGTHNPFIYFRF